MGEGERISAEITTCKIAVRNEAVLSIADARAVLTRVEDSLETVLDVLREMKWYLAEGSTDRDATIVEQLVDAVRTLWRWIRPPRWNPSLDTSDHAHRLMSLSQELDQILRDTTFAGTPVFADSPPRPTFVVGAAQGDPIEISIDPLSAAGLSVAFGDTPSSRRPGSRAKQQAFVDGAMDQVRQRIDEIDRFRDRLGLVRQAIEPPRDVRGAPLRTRAPLRTTADASSVREHLAITMRRIMEDADQAARAQANELGSAAKRLAMSLYGSDDEASARVYMLDHDGEHAPMTHLRRTMIRSRP